MAPSREVGARQGHHGPLGAGDVHTHTHTQRYRPPLLTLCTQQSQLCGWRSPGTPGASPAAKGLSSTSRAQGSRGGAPGSPAWVSTGNLPPPSCRGSTAMMQPRGNRPRDAGRMHRARSGRAAASASTLHPRHRPSARASHSGPAVLSTVLPVATSSLPRLLSLSQHPGHSRVAGDIPGAVAPAGTPPEPAALHGQGVMQPP